MNKYYILALAAVLFLVVAACAKENAPPEDSGVVDAEYTPCVETSYHPQPTPTKTPEPCPITDEEITMLAKVLWAEAQVISWRGDQYGVSYRARQAAVAWVALNRYDRGGYGDTLAEVLTRPAQFAYDPATIVTDEMLALARDVVNRWWAEKQGDTVPGRTIPADYFFFDGDGLENHFRKEYERTGEVWDWSLPDPYQ